MKIEKKSIYAAEDDAPFGGPGFDDDEDEELSDTIDDVSDAVEDLQEEMEDVEDDEPDIDMNNNIDGKYIAECARCHGIFISSVSESDQYVECITGTCPLCDHDTDQYLKWVIKAVK